MSFEEVIKGGWAVIQTIVSMVTPFALLWLGWQHTHREKTEEKAEKSAKAAVDNRHNEVMNSIKAVADSVTKIDTEVASLRKDLKLAKEDTVDLRKDLNHLAALNRMNGQYTHEVAQLVTVLAEGMRDQHLDGNITNAVAKYRKFESNAVGAFIIGDDLDEQDD